MNCVFCLKAIVFKGIFMKKILFVLFIFFTVSSCTYENSSFRRISKEEAIQSWAWKIFIFTDEGDYQPVEIEENKIDGHIKEKPIFAKDIWKMKPKDDLFFKNDEIAFKEGYKTYFGETRKNQ